MNNKELEKRIRHAVQCATPEVLERIIPDSVSQTERKREMGNQKNQTESARISTRKKGWIISGAIVAFAAALMLCIGLFQLTRVNSVDAIVSIDVNPSVELLIDRNDKVLETRALNADAEKILDGMELKDVDLDVAVNALIGSMLKNGYLNDLGNAVLVSVENDNAERSSVLQQQISADISSVLKQSNHNVTVLNQEIKSDDQLEDFADQYGISYGKALFIYRIVEQDSTLSMEQLAGMSISRLCNLVNTKGLNLNDFVEIDDDDDRPLLSGQQYIGEEKAKEIALGQVPNGEIVKIHLDMDDGTAEYDLELIKGNHKYDIEIDALTGAITGYDIDTINSGVQNQQGSGTQNSSSSSSNGGAQGQQGNGAQNSSSSSSSSGVKISMEEAKQIALQRLPGAVLVEIEFDRDDGICVYEGELRLERQEVDFEINALTGAVVKWDVDYDD